VGLFRDRIVLIGTTAESIPDNFKVPFSGAMGIVIHANLTSQIINAGLEERPFIKTVQHAWIWIWIWSLIGATISLQFIRFSLCDQKTSLYRLETSIFFQGICLLITHYLIFLNGFWVPILSSLLANFLATIVTTSHHNRKLSIQACFDELTQIFNRRYFDKFLQKQASKKGNIALIFCDVDCFKIYNDTYGHQAGDKCLIQVAAAISVVVLKFGVVARYGGEEFAIILPNTDLAKATQIAERILQQVRGLNIPHINSTAHSFVTISCGVVSMNLSSNFLLSDLILKADKALYMAKNQGRDRLVAYTDLIGDR
jgi:diguanylate cyclase (GGDEF)-like protein